MDTDGQPPNYYRLLLLRLRCRLLLEMHKNVTNNDVDGFQNYWLHKQAPGKLKKGKTENGTLTVIETLYAKVYGNVHWGVRCTYVHIFQLLINLSFVKKTIYLSVSIYISSNLYIPLANYSSFLRRVSIKLNMILWCASGVQIQDSQREGMGLVPGFLYSF
jgi:hypothetical protein